MFVWYKSMRKDAETPFLLEIKIPGLDGYKQAEVWNIFRDWPHAHKLQFLILSGAIIITGIYILQNHVHVSAERAIEGSYTTQNMSLYFVTYKILDIIYYEILD